MASSDDAAENEQQVDLLNATQSILIRTDRSLSLTITKTGLELVQRLSTLFNDVYNKRLPPADDHDLPLLSIHNFTGQDILIENLKELRVKIVTLRIKIFTISHLIFSFKNNRI